MECRRKFLKPGIYIARWPSHTFFLNGGVRGNCGESESFPPVLLCGVSFPIADKIYGQRMEDLTYRSIRQVLLCTIARQPLRRPAVIAGGMVESTPVGF